jgi:hypothetical protein
VTWNNFMGLSNGPWRALAMLGTVLTLGTNLAQAAGTPSNTTVSNLATLTFSVGGVVQPTIGSSPTGNSSGAGTATTFLVDKKINLTVTTNDATFIAVSPGQSAAVTTFTVTNTGNDPQDFALASIQQANGTSLFGGSDDFNSTGCAQFVESGATGGYQAGQDTATFVTSLASGSSSTVYVVCNIPNTQVNGDISVIALTATAKVSGSCSTSCTAVVSNNGSANTAAVDTVFADGAGTDDAANDAVFSSRDAFKVSAPSLTITKTVAALCDTVVGNVGGFQHQIPSAIVRYTITISNSAGATSSAILTTLSDTLSASTTIDPNMVTGAGAAANCSSGSGTPSRGAGFGFQVTDSNGARVLGGTAASGFFTTATDADGVDYNAGTITVNFATALPAGGGYAAGELKVGETTTVYYNATIN